MEQLKKRKSIQQPTHITVASGKTYERLNTPRKSQYYELIEEIPSIKKEYERKLKEKHGIQPTPIYPSSAEYITKSGLYERIKPIPNVTNLKNIISRRPTLKQLLTPHFDPKLVKSLIHENPELNNYFNEQRTRLK